MDRIDTQTPKGILPGLKAQGAARVPAPNRTSAEAAPAGTGGVPVSSVATAGAEPPIAHERVAEIRKALDEGRYPVDPAGIADAMIASGLLLRTR